MARIGYARTLTRDRSTEAHTPGRCGCRTASCQPSVNVLDGGSGSPGPWLCWAGPSGAVRAPGARARLAGGLVARGRLGAGAGCRAPQGVGALAPGLCLGQQGRGHPAARLARARAPGRPPSALLGQDGEPVAPQVVRGDPVRLGRRARGQHQQRRRQPTRRGWGVRIASSTSSSVTLIAPAMPLQPPA